MSQYEDIEIIDLVTPCPSPSHRSPAKGASKKTGAKEKKNTSSNGRKKKILKAKMTTSMERGHLRKAGRVFVFSKPPRDTKGTKPKTVWSKGEYIAAFGPDPDSKIREGGWSTKVKAYLRHNFGITESINVDVTSAVTRYRYAFSPMYVPARPPNAAEQKAHKKRLKAQLERKKEKIGDIDANCPRTEQVTSSVPCTMENKDTKDTTALRTTGGRVRSLITNVSIVKNSSSSGNKKMRAVAITRKRGQRVEGKSFFLSMPSSHQHQCL